MQKLLNLFFYHYYTPFMMLKSKWSEAKMLDKLTY